MRRIFKTGTRAAASAFVLASVLTLPSCKFPEVSKLQDLYGSIFKSGSEATAPGQKKRYEACLFDGRVLKEGESVTAYKSPFPIGAEDCVSETRTCKGDTLTGSFTIPNCTKLPPVAPPQSQPEKAEKPLAPPPPPAPKHGQPHSDRSHKAK